MTNTEPYEMPTAPASPAAGLAGALRVLEARAAGLVGPRTAGQQLERLLAPLLDGQPLRVDWSGLSVAADRGGPAVITGATDGIPVAIAVQAVDQRRLALLLSDALYAPELTCALCGCTEAAACDGGCHWVPAPPGLELCSSCATSCAAPGCGTPADLDPSDPLTLGWVRVEVAGAEAGPVWVCGPACALARITTTGEEIAAADRAAANGTAQEGPEPGTAATVTLDLFDGPVVTVRLDGWDLTERPEHDVTRAVTVLQGWVSVVTATTLPDSGPVRIVHAHLPGDPDAELSEITGYLDMDETGGAHHACISWTRAEGDR